MLEDSKWPPNNSSEPKASLCLHLIFNRGISQIWHYSLGEHSLACYYYSHRKKAVSVMEMRAYAVICSSALFTALKCTLTKNTKKYYGNTFLHIFLGVAYTIGTRKLQSFSTIYQVVRYISKYRGLTIIYQHCTMVLLLLFSCCSGPNQYKSENLTQST